LTRSKWFFSLVSLDTRCHSYFYSFNELELKIPKNNSLTFLAGANIKPFLILSRGFLIFYFIFLFNLLKAAF